MWADPIEMAAIRGENQREADRRGITLEELLKEQKEQKEKNDKEFYSDIPVAPSPRYINEMTGKVYDKPFYEKPKSSWIKLWYWFFRLN